MKPLRITSLVLAAAIVAVGCGSSSTKSSPTTVAPTTVAPTTVAPTTVAPTTVAPTTVTPAPSATTAPVSAATVAAGTTPTAGGVAVQIVDTSLGKILADGSGRTLYLFTKDSGGTSACTGGCASAWPALIGAATPGTGLGAEDFATITRDDGTKQITFYGHPLYRYAGDAAAGDVAGQGLNNAWYVIGADGNAIKIPTPTS